MFYSTGEIIALIAAGEEAKFYNSRQWRSLSKDVIRDGKNECKMCKKEGKVSAAILTHHLNELKMRPDLAYSRTFIDVDGTVKDNLIPLCYECHEKIHKRGIYAEPKKDSNKFYQEEKW